MKKFINYAHRGASEYYPENTILSFDKGLEMEANGIETDVQKTKDGVLVLSTEGETMYNSMNKEEHYALISQAFANIGIGSQGFALRLRGKKADTFTQSMNTLKESFPSTEIEIK